MVIFMRAHLRLNNRKDMIMRFICKFIAWCSVCLFFIPSCVDGLTQLDNNISEIETIDQIKYDEQVYNFAKAVNRAVSENVEFRKLIKSEVEKQIDGDFDMLISQSLNYRVKPSQPLITKTKCQDEMSVKELLSYYYHDNAPTTKSAETIIDELISNYPNLQVSVPIHAEEWDPETYVPNVAFIPYDYKDRITEIVPGLDADGNEIQIDAINEPDKPVIVVGLSERASMVQVSTQSTTVSESPSIHLSGVYSNGAVQLSYTTTNVSSVSNVKVYRTRANSFSFSLLGAMYGNAYYDWNISENQTYLYYIVADCISSIDSSSMAVTSNTLNVYTDTTIPKPVSSLNVINEYANKNYISWTNPSGESYKTQIFRTTPSKTDDLIATLSGSDDYYYDAPTIPGEKWIYTVKKYNPNTNETSSSKRTFLYNPYRNPSAESKVMLKKIYVNRDEIEGWLDGKPEFYVTTFGHQKMPDGTFKIDTLSVIIHQFAERSNDSGRLNKLMADWSFYDDSNYYPVLNVSLIEYDRTNTTFTLNVDAKIGKKINEDISLTAHGKFYFKYSNEGQDCGTVTLRYYENPEKNLTFSNCGAYITVSEVDDNN